MDATDGLTKDDEVPRPRIELGTRGFSVRQENLCIEILTQLAAVGQAADKLLLSIQQDDSAGDNGHKSEEISEVKESLKH